MTLDGVRRGFACNTWAGYLSTTPFLASAIRLYEQAGFVHTSAPPYELHGTALFTMEKVVASRRPEMSVA